MDPKELKKLAAACRAAGIRTYKDKDIEFTLDDAPQKVHGNSKAAPKDYTNTDPVSDGLSPNELMFWSSGVADEVVQSQE